MTDDLAERLAAWLEDLGLESHLAEAGLPSFTRDASGLAQWVDPHTGDPLTAEQLDQLDTVLHSDGSEREYAVPLALVQLARQARVRKTLLASPVHSYGSLAELRGESVNATRFAVHKASAAHALLVVPHHRDQLIPAFQLTAAGEPRVEMLPLLLPLLSAGMDPWHAWAWLTQPVALLGGLVPHEAAADPDEAALAAHAAVRLAERVVSSG
ncbi:O6-methylguanine-DNA--protein-cysteine methyltransferase [Nocardioides daedukensis]|uniref:O6-methylguanine-DNA--protein-cysteine methyltransferase n=1 Tax=Nocardioides daedukensis TaxID=634462 RepID=A0A7Y9RZS3_9ACTN|nr:hypothetical protein [Nocardioides daedukensis]NYG59275.1 O6-methylguanine-DNA--protein-cysteine methyltransferase [Nocardioides daedukensis]